MDGTAATIDLTFTAAITAKHNSLTSECLVKYVDWALLSGGIKKARSVYTKCFDTLGLSHVNFFNRCLVIELSLGVYDMAKIRLLFERILRNTAETEADIWVQYAGVEMNFGDHRKAGDIYWRAVKTLKEPDEFIRVYNLARLNLEAST